VKPTLIAPFAYGLLPPRKEGGRREEGKGRKERPPVCRWICRWLYADSGRGPGRREGKKKKSGERARRDSLPQLNPPKEGGGRGEEGLERRIFINLLIY